MSYIDSDLGRIVHGFRQWRDEPFEEKSPRLLAEMEERGRFIGVARERLKEVESGG